MRVLAIESSCDESAVAVLDGQRGLLAHELYSQVELHRAYGGVVPELASRDHVRRLLPLVSRGGGKKRGKKRRRKKIKKIKGDHAMLSWQKGKKGTTRRGKKWLGPRGE